MRFGGSNHRGVARRMIWLGRADLCGGVHALRRMGAGRGGVVRGGVAALARGRGCGRRVAPAFAVFTLLAVRGPVLWLGYNQHF